MTSNKDNPDNLHHSTTALQSFLLLYINRYRSFEQNSELTQNTQIYNLQQKYNKYKEEKNGAQHFSKIEEDNYVWNFVYDDFGRTKLTTEPDKATHLVYTMEGKENPQLLKISEKEILDYKKGENYELSKKKEKQS